MIIKPAKVSGMDKTEMFQNTVSARDVAEDGYNGMLDVISGLTFGQKLWVSSIPFMPKRTLLRQMRKMQENTL